MDKAGNDLTKIWASEEFKPFHDEEDNDAPTIVDPTPTKSNTTYVN